MKLKPLKWGDSDKLRIGEMVATSAARWTCA